MAGCEARQQIEPALRGENMVSTGDLTIDGNWCQVAVDVTHYGGQLYLSMVDCGPSRVVIWRWLHIESATHIIAQLRSIVIEQGLCDELLLDNSMAFRSAIVAQFADEWGIAMRFWAAYAKVAMELLRGITGQSGGLRRGEKLLLRRPHFGAMLHLGRRQRRALFFQICCLSAVGEFHLMSISVLKAEMLRVCSWLVTKFG